MATSPHADTASPVALQIPDLPSPLRMCVHGEQDQHISRRIREEGIWEPYETALVLAMLKAGDVFVDVGANIGYYPVIAAGVVGASGGVVAFEPDECNFQLMLQNVQINDCGHIVTAVQAGLAAQEGPGQLFMSEVNAGDHQVFAVGDERRSQAIRLQNGSDFLRGKLQRMDLLKVDVQGAEYAVMVGLLPLLQELPQLPRIILELTPLSLRQAGSSGRALIELLATLGQPLWIIDHIEHRLVASTAAELAQWCDDVDAVTGDMGFMNILVGASVDE